MKAVDGVDLEVKSREIFGFLGPNGAGKTTTLHILTTLLPLDGGETDQGGAMAAQGILEQPIIPSIRPPGKKT